MPQQSNLFSSSPPSGSTVQERQAPPQRPSRIPLWLRRVELYLYVIIRIYIGVIVLVLPWYAPLWADNQLLNHFRAWPRFSCMERSAGWYLASGC